VVPVNRPFFGVMGVAPPPAMGRISSMPPSVHTGNLDNKVLIAGTTLYLLVYAAGALFSVAMPMPPKDTARLTYPPLRQGIVASSS
jgi:acetamidase/formamidase